MHLSAAEGLYVSCNLMGPTKSVRFANNIVAGAPVTHAGNGSVTSCIDSLSGPNLVSTQVATARFVDVTAKDFHLSSTSPGVDVGVSLAGVVDFDYEGASRLGVPYDLGAFVAGAASTSGAALPGGR